MSKYVVYEGQDRGKKAFDTLNEAMNYYDSVKAPVILLEYMEMEGWKVATYKFSMDERLNKNDSEESL